MHYYSRFLLAFILLCALQAKSQGPYTDLPFAQEYHEGYPVGNDAGEGDVRSIALDVSDNAWIATAAGIRVKYAGTATWDAPGVGTGDGPAYCVLSGRDGNTWMGGWSGAQYFNAKQKKLNTIRGTEGPIAVICSAIEGVYLAGPKGIWLYAGDSVQRKNYGIPRSLRRMITDNHGGLWIASDVGVYHCSAAGTKQYVDGSLLISAAVKGLALDGNGRLWAAGLGGISILEKERNSGFITPKQGCPSVYLNCISKDADGTMWVGTDAGLARFAPDGTRSLRFSRRWLLDDRVRDISFDRLGNAWIATAKGVSVIGKKMMTLSGKQEYFYNILMKRHIRAPWIAGQCHLKTPGDINSWQAEDDDNDGEYTGNYLAMESFRYAVTKSPDAREKAVKAFNFLKLQEEITGGDGYFARTIVPAEWKDRIHDGNVT
jgi:ligand-binding sensor domain-containing protein